MFGVLYGEEDGPASFAPSLLAVHNRILVHSADFDELEASLESMSDASLSQLVVSKQTEEEDTTGYARKLLANTLLGLVSSVDMASRLIHTGMSVSKPFLAAAISRPNVFFGLHPSHCAGIEAEDVMEEAIRGLHDYVLQHLLDSSAIEDSIRNALMSASDFLLLGSIPDDRKAPPVARGSLGEVALTRLDIQSFRVRRFLERSFNGTDQDWYTFPETLWDEFNYILRYSRNRERERERQRLEGLNQQSLEIDDELISRTCGRYQADLEHEESTSIGRMPAAQKWSRGFAEKMGVA
eukprot:scaffold26_cov158-Amphora_coffeaeformis.AAC.6